MNSMSWMALTTLSLISCEIMRIKLWILRSVLKHFESSQMFRRLLVTLGIVSDI